jgi:prepilin signal peptidase PulO-like enzyme (type II secretory pathway)
MSLPAAGLALAASFVPGLPGPASALVGGLAGFGLFIALALLGRGAMGMGDVKLAGVIGLMLGYPAGLQALAVGILMGGLAAVGMLLARRVKRKSYIAYAPYLSLGALVVLYGLVGG